MVQRPLPCLLSGLLLLLTPLSVSSYSADAVYVPGRDYFSTLLAQVDGAHSSIFIAVYLFALYPERTQAQTTRLANALVAAKKRGVKVRLLLDKGEGTRANSDNEINANNRMAYQYLREQGIDVSFADIPSPAVMHAKAVVIDSAIVIMGSENFSDAAFTKNVEAGMIVRSRDAALAALADFSALPVMNLHNEDSVAALVPVKFIKDTTLLGRMVSSRNERLFDEYLYLLRLGYKKADTILDMDYNPLIRYLGLDSMPLKRSRARINADLKALQDEFKLISLTLHVEHNAQIRLNKIDTLFQAVPAGYFNGEWNRQLDFSGKVMELLNLYYSASSNTRPKWSIMVRTLASWLNVNQEFIWMGTNELRRKNLVAIEYFPWHENEETSRHPNVYLPLPLYDSASLAQKWLKLEAKYGKEKTDWARKYASIVYDDCDDHAVETLINLENTFGPDKVLQASKIIAGFAASNPHRCLDYFIGIIRKPE